RGVPDGFVDRALADDLAAEPALAGVHRRGDAVEAVDEDGLPAHHEDPRGREVDAGLVGGAVLLHSLVVDVGAGLAALVKDELVEGELLRRHSHLTRQSPGTPRCMSRSTISSEP